MSRSIKLALLVVLGLSITGCGFFNSLLNRGGEVETAEEEAPIEDGTVIESEPGAEPPEAAEDELFKEAMLPGLPGAFQVATAELLESTDPNERLKEVERDRPDPYAYVPVPPPPPATPPAPEDSPSPGQTQPGQPGGTAPGGQNGGNGRDDGDFFGDQDGFGQPDDRFPIEPLPILPEPTVVASEVEVSGVVQINGQTYAIVRAPGEPTSRYVRAGDRLSNGSIVVKRIETRPGSQPVVVLEERGVEIALPVGSNVGEQEETAAAPLPSTSSNVAALPFSP